MRLAQVVRPPQTWLLDDEVRPGRGLTGHAGKVDAGMRGGALPVVQPQVSSPGTSGGEGVNLDPHPDDGTCAVGAQLDGGELDADQRRPLLPLELDRPPDSDRREPGAPVPAVAVLRLAHTGAFLVPAPGIGCRRELLPHWRVETEGQRVGLSWPYPPGNVEDGLA